VIECCGQIGQQAALPFVGTGSLLGRRGGMVPGAGRQRGQLVTVLIPRDSTKPERAMRNGVDFDMAVSVLWRSAIKCCVG
jgi:hypothetical protein